MERIQTVSEMRDNIDRLSTVISAGALFTADDAKALSRVLDKLAWHRNAAIRYELTCGRSVQELSELWGLSADSINAIRNLPLGEVQYQEMTAPLIDKQGDMVPYTQHSIPVIRDYPNLLNPEKSLAGEAVEAFAQIRKFSGTDKVRHAFRVAWSIGDDVSGYEFTHKHPGNEAHATGAIQSWTAEQLCELLNEMEKTRKPMIASGAETGRVSCAKPNRTGIPREATALMSVREIGARFKQLRKQANHNQTEAGMLIGEHAVYVSSLERAKFPNKRVTAYDFRMHLDDYENKLKALNLID